jgi:hypothetical protein
MLNFYGQSLQDKFIITMLKEKKNGYFIEIGSGDPIKFNNSYLLEKDFNYKGIMVEFNSSFLSLYKEHRQNSIHVINDAIIIDYKDILQKNNFPNEIDYLQIDLEVNNESTINTLIKLDNEILDEYKFAVITFEHDIYRDNNSETRKKSREIFKKRGYFCVLNDVSDNQYPYEDWYVHPDLVDMNYVNSFKNNNLKNYKKSIMPNIDSIESKDILF